MKLLLISVKSNSPAGGIAVWTDYFLAQCQASNVDCHLVNTEISSHRSATGKRHLWDELIRTTRIVRHLRKQLKENTFDAVYLNTSCGTYGLFRDTYLARLVCKKSIPLITHYHCEIPYWVKRRSSIRCLEKLARMSHQNLVLCQNSKQFLQKQYGLDSHKVPNFVNTTLLRTTPKAIDGPVKEVVFVGQVSEPKGAAELYAVAQRLPDIHFTFVGPISAAVSAWSKPDNVTLTGQISQNEVIPYLDNADVFLLPSHTEGSSMALMEAMARGLPAIATDTGANAEMLADGCGMIVKRHDVEAMVEAIDLLKNSSVRQMMASKAITHIKNDYTENNVEHLFEIIKRFK